MHKLSLIETKSLLLQSMNTLKHYFSLIKFSHTIFAMPFAIVGASLGYKYGNFTDVPWNLFIYVILCMFFARSAAMSFNRFADARYDLLNPRTQNREIPQGLFKPKQVLLFTIVNSFLFIVTTYFINPLVFYLSPVALIVVLGYSLAKRFTFLSHIWLGIALALAPLGAFMVFSASFSWIPIPFSIIVIFWVSGFDIMYATQDAEIDKRLGLYSIPSKYGVKKALTISQFLHIIAICMVWLTAFLFEWHYTYYIAAAIFSLMILWEHLLIFKDHNSINIHFAFATINSYAGLMYGLFVVIAIFLT